MSNDKASGQYILNEYEDEVGQNNPDSTRNLINLDGNGHGTYLVLASGKSGSFTYSVATDGMLTIS